MWDRRRFLQLSLAGAVGASLPRLSFAQATKTSPIRPRYFVTFFLRGGMDAVYTFNPKTRAEVDADVDVPYAANDILSGGDLAFGPHLAPLVPFAGKMAIVRGVQVKTANHESGAYQMLRMRTDPSTLTPSLYDIIGQTRDTQPLGSVTMGMLASFEHSPNALTAPTNGYSALEQLDRLADDEIEMLAQAFKKHLARFPSWESSAKTEQTRDHTAQLAAFFERLKGVRRFADEPWVRGKGRRARAAKDMQRLLWLLENDLAKGVYMKVQMDWDSHYRNAAQQRGANGAFFGSFARFLDELHKRRNAYGTLAEQTVVVVGSELGRFPVLNGNLGKDHFPETGLLFFGAGIQTNDGRGAVFGETDKRMAGRKLSLKTGKTDDAGADHLTLDDVGTTLMHMAGLKPELYGYTGRRLAFLERA